MTLAAIDFLSISINILLLVFVFVCGIMTLIILMQRPKQEGLGAAFGAGVTDQVFGARTTNVLQRGTVYLGSAFFILSLVLAILIGQQNRQKSLLTPKKAESAKVEPAKPVVPKSLSEELPEPAPVTPATPDAQVPAAPAPVTPAPVVPAAPETAPAPAPVEPAPAGSTQKPEGQ